MKYTLLILSLLTLSALIPLKSYSQGSIQDTLVINSYQARQILKDKARLRFLEKNSKQDSLHIAELENQVKLGKGIEDNQKILIDSKDKTIQRLRFQNRLIIFSATVVTGYLLYKTLE